MEKKIKARVVILPTNKITKIGEWCLHLDPNRKLSYGVKVQEAFNMVENNQYLYIVSEDKIEKGDWTLMFDDFGNLFLSDEPQQYLGVEAGHHLNNGLRKIIATTNPSLTVPNYIEISPSHKKISESGRVKTLPEPKKFFILEYIDAYNAGEPITNVLVDYEEFYYTLAEQEQFGSKYTGINGYTLSKIDFQNTITITKIKNDLKRWVHVDEEQPTEQRY
jgi:hypothetical protein